MKAAAAVLILAFALSAALPADADASRGRTAWKMLKYGRKVPARQSSSLLGEFAAGTAGGAAGAWMYDQMSEPKDRNECIDCQKPYRERKELEERWRKGK